MAKGSKRGGAGAPELGAPVSSSGQNDIAELVAALSDLDLAALGLCWRNHLGGAVPAHLPRWLLIRVLGFRLQAATHGDLDRATLLRLKRESGGADERPSVSPFATRAPASREGADLRPGALLAREWRGKLERVTVLEAGFAWNGKSYGSLSQVAKAITGTNWNGHRFFGLRSAAPPIGGAATSKLSGRQPSRSDALDPEPPR
jgi:hypothetical protein